MGKYQPLWDWVKGNATFPYRLTFDEAEAILGFPIDHAFLNEKKQLIEKGYIVKKISLKEKFIVFDKKEEGIDGK